MKTEASITFTEANTGCEAFFSCQQLDSGLFQIFISIRSGLEIDLECEASALKRVVVLFDKAIADALAYDVDRVIDQGLPPMQSRVAGVDGREVLIKANRDKVLLTVVDRAVPSEFLVSPRTAAQIQHAVASLVR